MGRLKANIKEHTGGCQNHGLFLGTLDIRCRTTIGIQNGTIILTATHMHEEGHQGDLRAGPSRNF